MKRLIFSLTLLSILLIGCATPTPELKPTLAPTVLPPTAVPPPTAPTATTVQSTVLSTATSVPTATTLVKPTNTAALATAAPTAVLGGAKNFIPAGQSVWEVSPAADQLVGTCKSNPITLPYGLIAITQSGNTITMRDQGVGAYTLTQAAPNVFVYNGPSNIFPGTLNMTLTFVSDTSWTMRAVTVLKDDPGCQHTHNYQAIFKWVR